MKKSILAGLVSLSALAAAPLGAQAYPEYAGTVVTDAAGVLTRAQEDSVRALLAPLRNRGMDVRVVAIGSIRDYTSGHQSIESFATGLYNAWLIGDDRPQNDGALLLVAVRDRKVRIELGDGAPPVEPLAQRVIDEDIVPAFRAGDMAGGILAGTERIAAWYRDAPVAAASAPPPAPAAPEYYIPPPRSQREISRQYDPARGIGSGVVGLLVLGGGVLGLASYARNRKRKCTGCGAEMARLDEAADDAYLDPGQQREEALSSVDYDVWKCGRCGDHAIFPHKAWFSSHDRCAGCGYRTARSSQHTIANPTYHSTGTAQVTEQCVHCGYRSERLITLPRLTPPPERDDDSSSSHRASSSWGSSGGSSGGSWGGSSSSGSSGGSSSGTGSSSGRGASGSW